MQALRDLEDLFLKLISATQAKGPSCTKLVYLMNGTLAVLCALVMTIGGVEVYCAHLKAEPNYWFAVGSMWTVTLGFGTLAKHSQNKTTERIEGQPRRTQAEMGD
jgi:hypothetical protein